MNGEAFALSASLFPPCLQFPCKQLPSATLRGFDNPRGVSVLCVPEAFCTYQFLFFFFPPPIKHIGSLGSFATLLKYVFSFAFANPPSIPPFFTKYKRRRFIATNVSLYCFDETDGFFFSFFLLSEGTWGWRVVFSCLRGATVYIHRDFSFFMSRRTLMYFSPPHRPAVVSMGRNPALV